MSEKNTGELPKKVVEKVAIVGAGLGGLAVAIALRNRGIDAQLYERAKELRPVGAGLSLFPNGLNSLDAIQPGIVESLKRAGSQARFVNLKKSTGELIVQTSNPREITAKYGQPMLNIRWSRLQEILASALPSESIHLNCRCIDFEVNNNSVTVNFDDNKTVQADLLIGSDGLNSAVRKTLIKDGSPRYAGRLSWRAVLPYSHEQLLPDEVTIITSSDGKVFTLLDVGDGYIFWSAAALSPTDSMSQNAAAVKERVLAEFAGWSEPVQAIVEATEASTIVERPIFDRAPLQSWSQGRVTLLGDAAHPMVPSLGQGANTAFEDAWELSQYLSDAPSIEEAIARYESSRAYRTQVIQARSAFQGSRSYDADNQVYLKGVFDIARWGNSEFDRWLYSYNPSAIANSQD